MLRSLQGARGAEAPRKRQAGDLELIALTTAVPANTINQDEVRDEAAPYLAGMQHMLSTFGNAGVHHRHMVKPVSWYLESHDWVERTAVFQEAALELLVQVTESCLADARMEPSEIDAVVLVTSTGISIPTLDAALANHFGFKSSVERTPIFGLGCAGGATGLARAAQLAEANPDFVVLLLVVEICTANLSLLNVSKTDAVAFTLFGDGGSAVLLRRGGSRKRRTSRAMLPPASIFGQTREIWRASRFVRIPSVCAYRRRLSPSCARTLVRRWTCSCVIAIWRWTISRALSSTPAPRR
ncbi:hypothetical protein AUC69_07565 [Methyloceanibacter superfactus]|uniref:Chalcone/stilbene synthase N-terminal domain-containing protein n=1 Tax=Methyloceanibacter superfactus TaxID=1774969 RepID=A0A1E3W4U2_9HYPH|nr:hypothetical protein AUC69_07565 [Methyloceanibacter superfactus]